MCIDLVSLTDPQQDPQCMYHTEGLEKETNNGPTMERWYIKVASGV